MATISSSRAAPADSNKPDSHPYTCNTCQVAFRNSDLQKGHMRQDWHRYNLKRRVASLPPISSDVFNEKVLQAKAATSAQADKARYEKFCDICQRTYYSENSYQNHISGQKHRAKEAAMQRKPDTLHHDDASSVVSSTFSLGEPQRNGASEVDPDAEEEFSQVIQGMKKTNIKDLTSPLKRPANPHPSSEDMDVEKEDLNASEKSGSTPTPSRASAPAPSLKACLFCNYQSPTVILNAAHMERFHGMFIPEKQYLVDLDGLIGSLQERVREEFECLYCGKYKSDVFAIQTHMRDKGHCKIPFTTEAEQLEIGEFYDFRSTYSDDEDEDSDESMDDDERNGGAKLGMKRPTTILGEDGDEIMAEEDGWETDSSASSLDSADLTAVPAGSSYHQYERLEKHPHHSKTDPRSHHQKDGWHSHAHKHAHTAFYDEYELHLPSGKSVGHRSLNRYFRQNLHDHPSPEERAQRQQLAIENGEDPEPNGERQIARQQFGRDHRAVVRAGDERYNGVTDRVSRGIAKQEHKTVRRADATREKMLRNYAKPTIAHKHFRVTEGR